MLLKTLRRCEVVAGDQYLLYSLKKPVFLVSGLLTFAAGWIPSCNGTHL